VTDGPSTSTEIVPHYFPQFHPPIWVVLARISTGCPLVTHSNHPARCSLYQMFFTDTNFRKHSHSFAGARGFDDVSFRGLDVFQHSSE